METLCRIREIQRSVVAFEHEFEKCYGISLNEGMMLCSLCRSGCMTSGEISQALGLTPSNTSKVIASAEKKDLVTRSICSEDKRQMHFTLTKNGEKLLGKIDCNKMDIPECLR